MYGHVMGWGWVDLLTHGASLASVSRARELLYTRILGTASPGGHNYRKWMMTFLFDFFDCVPQDSLTSGRADF